MTRVAQDELQSTKRDLRSLWARNSGSTLPGRSSGLPSASAAPGAAVAGGNRSTYDDMADRVRGALQGDYSDLVATFNLKDPADQERLRAAIREKILALPDVLPGDIEFIQRKVEATILSVGDLAEVLADPSVLEIQMLGPQVGYSRRRDKPFGPDRAVRFAPDRRPDSVVNDLQHFARMYGAELDASQPYRSFMALGWRVVIHIPPHIDGYPFSLVMRRGAEADNRITGPQLIDNGTVDAVSLAFLYALLDSKQTVLIFGPQRAGKTVLQSVLIDHANPNRGMNLLLQDIVEIHPTIPALSLHTVDRPQNPITMSDLLEMSLRDSAVRLIVGEIRRREALAFIESAQMGTDAMGTFHAKSPLDATERLVTLLLASIPNLSDRAAYRTIHQAIGWYVQMARFVEPSTGIESFRMAGIYQLLPTDGLVTRDNYRPIIRWQFEGWDPVTHAAVGHHYVANPVTEDRYEELLEAASYSVDIPPELRPAKETASRRARDPADPAPQTPPARRRGGAASRARTSGSPPTEPASPPSPARTSRRTRAVASTPGPTPAGKKGLRIDMAGDPT